MACVRKRRGKWVLDYRDQLGRRHWEAVRTSKKEAEERLAQRLVEIGNGRYNPGLSNVTVRAYAERWLETYVRPNLKPSTLKAYSKCLAFHILPVLGHIPFRSLRRDTVIALLADLPGKGLSRGSVRLVYATLRALMNTAVDEGALGSNPALRLGRFINGRMEAPQEIKPLTREELSAFLATVMDRFPSFYPLFLTLARTGVRLGEALALKWEDIDFDARLIHVRRNLGTQGVETPKNGKSRKVDMSSQLATVLRDFMKQRDEEVSQKGWGKMSEWVFCAGSGALLDPSNLRKRVFYGALRLFGLRRVRIHDFRHTYASLLIQQGESLAYVKEQLGHHSIQVTADTYGHLVPGGNRRAVDRLDEGPVLRPVDKFLTTLPIPDNHVCRDLQ